MFGETTISYVKIGNHPIETTTIYKWLFGVPGTTFITINFQPTKTVRLNSVDGDKLINPSPGHIGPHEIRIPVIKGGSSPIPNKTRQP